MKKKSSDKIMGACTSISVTADSTHFFAGSSKATIYWCNSDSISPELRNTCHYDRVNDIAFPAGYSDLFATCSINDIRVWNAKTRQELLRIEVPGLECHAVKFMNGKTGISRPRTISNQNTRTKTRGTSSPMSLSKTLL